MRDVALTVLRQVLERGRPLDAALAAEDGLARLSEVRERAFARLLVTTVLRRKGQLEDILARLLDFPLRGRIGAFRPIMLLALAQLLFLDKPLHVVASLALAQCRRDRRARHLERLATALLRRAAKEGAALVAAQDVLRLNTPDWLWRRWQRHYGEATARAIAHAHLRAAPLDLSLKNPDEAAAWAERLQGRLLSTGTLRRQHRGRIESLAGYADGAWWVQDAASALPVQLLGPIRGLRVADLCAAPGGKTAQLAAAGARVVAVDSSASRLARLADNLRRLDLRAEVICADLFEYQPAQPFDAIVLDAPCSATGTIRRHPDLPHLKSETDIAELAGVQARLLDRCQNWLRSGGRMVYCTCSLEPEEGEAQIAAFLARHKGMQLQSARADAPRIPQQWCTTQGLLRTLPCHAPDPAHPDEGMDGFFAACLVKT